MMNTPNKRAGRVIFVNRYFHPDHSATSQLLTDLACGLAAIRMDVWVLTSRQLYQDPNARIEPYEEFQGVKIRRLWSTQFGRKSLGGRLLDYISFYASVLWTALRHFTTSDVVVYMTDPPLLSLAGLIGRRLRRHRYVNWLQDIFPDTAQVLGLSPGGPAKRLLETFRNRSIRAAETNIVLGQRMAERVRGHVRDAKIQIIHNWAPGDSIHPVPRASNHLRLAWGLDTQFVVGYSGNMGKAHEFLTILGAAEQLRTSPIVFLFVGDGAQKRMIESESASRCLANVIFKPYQSRHELSESLSVPDAHFVSLNPALEGCIVPSKFYGIAAAGRPTLFIGNAEGEIASIVTRNRCGFVVPPQNSGMLAEKIRLLVADPALCASMGDSARELYEKEFNLSRAIQAWQSFLAALQ